jgi:hypothetical protein
MLAGATRLVVVDPAGRRHEHEEREPFAFHDTAAAGAYRVLTATSGAELADDARAAFVVAPPLTESDLVQGEVRGERSHAEDGEVRGAVVRRSVAPWLFLAAGLFALIEAILRSRGPLRAKLVRA